MTTIITKNSSTAGAAPTAGDLVQGELAVNVTDKALYTENASGTVVKLNTPSIVDNGNATAITIDSSENVGVGVTPSAWGSTYKAIELIGGNSVSSYPAAGIPAMFVQSNAYFNGSNWTYKVNGYANQYILNNNVGTHTWYTAPSGTAGNAISFTQAMTLDASGNLGVGGTAPISRIQTFNGSDIRLSNTDPGGSTAKWGEVIFSLAGSPWDGSGASIASYATYANQGDLRFYYSAGGARTEAARIDLSGNLLVGTTSTVVSGKQTISYSGAVNNGITLNETAGTANTGFSVFAVNGTVIGSVVRVGSTSAVVYNTTSDERLKSNIEDAMPVLDKLMSVKVRQYDWTDGDLHQEYGFIAQELEPVLSGVVTKGKTEDDVWQLDYSRLTPHLIKAIQEQQTLIQDQLALINSLTARVEALENK